MSRAQAFSRSSHDEGPLARALASLPFQVAVEAHWRLLDGMEYFHEHGDAQRFNDVAQEVLLTAALERNTQYREAAAECESVDWGASPVDVASLIGDHTSGAAPR